MAETFQGRLTVWACVGDDTGAYCPGDIMASGVRLAELDSEGRRIVACSEYWPFGTTFIVAAGTEGEMVGVCWDRGGMVIQPTHLDFYFYYAKDGFAWLQEVGDYAEVRALR